jgi:hypothetical protein
MRLGKKLNIPVGAATGSWWSWRLLPYDSLKYKAEVQSPEYGVG